MKRSLSFYLSGALVLSASVALLMSLLFAQPRQSHSVEAIYAHGVLRASILYEAPRSGEGNLLVEVLNPEDGVVAHVDRRVYARFGKWIWEQDIPLPKTL